MSSYQVRVLQLNVWFAFLLTTETTVTGSIKIKKKKLSLIVSIKNIAYNSLKSSSEWILELKNIALLFFFLFLISKYKLYQLELAIQGVVFVTSIRYNSRNRKS